MDERGSHPIVEGDITRLSRGCDRQRGEELAARRRRRGRAIHRAAGRSCSPSAARWGLRDRGRQADPRPSAARRLCDPHRRPGLAGGGEGEPALLASCYRRCFEIARTNGLRTLAFPAISCGVYGYPIEPATRIAMAEARRALAGDPELE